MEFKSRSSSDPRIFLILRTLNSQGYLILATKWLSLEEFLLLTLRKLLLICYGGLWLETEQFNREKKKERSADNSKDAPKTTNVVDTIHTFNFLLRLIKP